MESKLDMLNHLEEQIGLNAPYNFPCFGWILRLPTPLFSSTLKYEIKIACVLPSQDKRHAHFHAHQIQRDLDALLFGTRGVFHIS